MKTYYHIEQLQTDSAVALGFFDGMHLAHKQVIGKAVALKIDNLSPTVLTFSMDVPYKNGVKTIITDKVKLDLLEVFGVEQVVIPPFSTISELGYQQFFMEIVVNKLRAKAIICGYDYRFGKGAHGTVDKLRLLCEQNDIALYVIEQYKEEDMPVSSTAIRGYLGQGNIEQVNHLLGYPYYIKAMVNSGKALGRTIGFPTINQHFEATQITPLFGVYHTNATIDGKIYQAVSNVGVNPTVDSKINPRLETYIIDFTGDLYGQEIKVEFVSLIREERKFESVEALRQAIENDVLTVTRTKGGNSQNESLD